MKFICTILPFVMAACGLSLAEQAADVPQTEVLEQGVLEQREAKPKKSKKRNVGRAAQQKRRALREQGIKKVHAMSPSGWPDKIPVPKDTKLQECPKKGNFFVYETNNYVFHSPVALDSNACDTVGRLFECAYEANKAVGEVLPVPRTEEDRSKKKYMVQLWPTREQYIQNGGPSSSSGVFSFAVRRVPGQKSRVSAQTLAQDKVMVPFPSLGLSADGHVASEDIETHTLVHELTHQNFVYNNLPIWCNEGWAEYVGYVPYVGEDLDFTRCFGVILKKAQTQASAGALNFNFNLTEFFVMDQQNMYSFMGQGKDTYTLSTMIITFYVHMSGKKGVAALKAYMQALLDGESEEEATAHLIKPFKNAKNLQKEFIKAWKRKKVEVNLSDID